MKRSEIIEQYVRVNRKYEVMFMPKVKRALHQKTKSVIADLKQGGYQFASGNLHTDVGNELLGKVISNLYTTVGSSHARLTYSRLRHDRMDKGFGFNAEWTKFILDYLSRFLLQKITFAVSETTREALLRALNKGVTAGLGVDGMIDILDKWPYERYQAARIVRTEINRAANVGAMAQETTGEYEQQKEWISVRDFRTRGNSPEDHANHVALNGTVLDAGDEFTDPRNGDRLKFPGDPDGKAESTINCRCNAAFVNKRDANGELIPKRRSTAVTYPGQIRRNPVITIGAPKESDTLLHEKIDKLMLESKIDNIKYSPVISVSSDAQIMQTLVQMVMAMKEINRPLAWDVVFTRDSSGLINSPIKMVANG